MHERRVAEAVSEGESIVNARDSSYKYVGRLVVDFDAAGNDIAESYDPEVSGAYATDEGVSRARRPG